ncbi:MAG: tetratricopeptide repeat protein [Candidatus Eremiobacterota bacterium]
MFEKVIAIIILLFNLMPARAESSEEWCRKSTDLYESGKYEEAIKWLDKAIEADGHSITAWYNMGTCLFNLGRYGEAIECYNKVLTIDPDYAIAWYKTGKALREEGKTEEGYRCYEKYNDFFKHITVPPGMKAHHVINNRPGEGAEGPPWGFQKDPEVEKLLSIFKNPVTEDNQEIENITFPDFSGDRRDILFRHLATSAKWRLISADDTLTATRRFVINGDWTDNYGYFEDYHTDNISIETAMWIEYNIPVTRDLEESTNYEKGGTGSITLNLTEDHGFYSCLQLDSGKTALRILEKSPYRGRPLTVMALKFLKKELEGLFASKTASEKGFDPSLMPLFSVRKGKPDIKVRAGLQPGIYQVDAFINPGEKGFVYLKLFEETKNMPLEASQEDIYYASKEYTGWSDNKNEQFFYNSQITVYEGGFHSSYPARFELWFHPDDTSKPERKLLEKIFIISGWER